MRFIFISILLTVLFAKAIGWKWFEYQKQKSIWLISLEWRIHRVLGFVLLFTRKMYFDLLLCYFAILYSPILNLQKNSLFLDSTLLWSQSKLCILLNFKSLPNYHHLVLGCIFILFPVTSTGLTLNLQVPWKETKN